MELDFEQVERAAQEAWGASPKMPGQAEKWDSLHASVQESWRYVVRTVAPLLQLPWNEPTEQEISSFGTDAKEYKSLSQRFEWQCALAAFVRRRNAALIPKPVDPRREKIMEALMRPGVDSQPKMVDAILAALDGAK